VKDHGGVFSYTRAVIIGKPLGSTHGTRLGVDLEHDRSRYTVSPGGIVVLGKGITAD
jgi:glucose-1-phosphate adenylyltransferase